MNNKWGENEFKAFQSRQQSLSRAKLGLHPMHTIHFHGTMLINDTELPVVGMNAPLAEISIDWRSLFTGFFSDARLHQYNLKQEWARRIPNGSCWDSWDPAGAQHSEIPYTTSFRRYRMLTPGPCTYRLDGVRHECFVLDFRGTDDLDLTNAVSLLKSYSEINLAARIRTRRQRMKQHIKKVSWKDGVEQYFESELFAIQEIDPAWFYSTDGLMQPDYRPQRWVTLRYSHQPKPAKKPVSYEGKEFDRKVYPGAYAKMSLIGQDTFPGQPFGGTGCTSEARSD